MPPSQSRKADLDPKLPNQAPEVQQSMRQGSLCRNVGLASICALGKKGPFINEILKPAVPTHPEATPSLITSLTRMKLALM